MKISISILILGFVCFASSVQASLFLQSEQEWKQTATRYESTLTNYVKSLVFLRNQKLNDEFRKKISKIEFSLKKDTSTTVKYVEEYLSSQAGEVFLGDDLVMRLALLYYKDSNFKLQDKMDRYHEELSAYYAGRSKKSPALPAPNYESTEDYCKRLLKEYPKSEFADYASYLLGVIAEEKGEYTVALKHYKTIVDKYPYSKHRPESLWRFAELSYDFENYEASEMAYKELISNKENEYLAKAQYKLGALLYKDSRHKEAKKVFTNLFAYLDSGEQSSFHLSLKNEVHEYIGLLYVRGIPIKDLPQSSQRASLEAVAKRLERHNQYSYARDIYKNYIAKNYFNPQVPAYYALLIESLEGDGKLVESVQFRERLVNHIRRKGKWWNRNSEGETHYLAEEQLEKTRIEIARYYAEKGFNSGKRSDLMKARVSYRRFLARENFSEDRAVAAFELAQIESRLKMYKSAINNYKLAMNLGLNEEEKYLSAYNQFLAYIDMSAYKLPNLSLSVLDRESRQLNAREKNIEEAYFSLYESWKNTEYEIPAKYFMAQMYLAKSNTEKAESLFSSLLTHDNVNADKISYVEDSARWLVEIYTKEKQWAKVSAVNDRLKSLGAVSSLETSQLAKVRFNSSVLSEAEVLEEQGNKSAAAKAFLNFAINNPKNYESDRAVFKAAQLFREEGDFKSSNNNLKKIFDTEYRRDVLRMYTQNLVDSFQFSKAVSFVNSLSRKDRKTDPSLANVVKLKNFLEQEAEIAKRFFDLYKKNKQLAYGAQAFKEYLYSGQFEDSQKVLKQITKNHKGEIAPTAMTALQSWYEGNKETAFNSCGDYTKSYAKRKKVTSLQQTLNYQCFSIMSWHEDRKISLEERNEMKTDGAEEAYLFSLVEQGDIATKNLQALYQKISTEGLAIANRVQNLLEERGAYDYKKYETFPFQIARAESIPWRKLVRSNVDFDIEEFCNTAGYARCYNGLKKFSSKQDRKNYDLLLKIALVLDRDKDAIIYAQQWLESVSASERPELENLVSRLKLGDKQASREEYLKAIYNGDSSFNDYLQLAKYYYSKENIRAAQFVINTAEARFTEDSITQYTAHYLTGKRQGLLAEVVADPRLWFLHNLVGIDDKQNYIAKKSLLSGGEWYYSLRLLSSVQGKLAYPKDRNTGSAYYSLLSSYGEYRQRNWDKAKEKLIQAKSWGVQPVNTHGVLIERGVASETK